MKNHLNLVSWFGGKYPHLSWLIDQFPAGNYHFVDLMTGSANVALNVNYPLVTINDLNGEVVNLFKVLRDHENEFTRRVYFTPFSREELYSIIDSDPTDDIIERARRYFVRCQLGYGANGSQNNHKGAGFEYKLHKSNYYRVDNWNLKLKKLASIASKLRSFQIESVDALILIEKLDKPSNFIYVDPPYLMQTRSSGKRYKHEVDEQWHERLSEKLNALQHANFAISGYDHSIYDKLYDGCEKVIGPQSNATVSKRGIREVLWRNYRLRGQTLKLFR